MTRSHSLTRILILLTFGVFFATSCEEPVDLDEIDQLAQKDWKAAVKKLGADEAKRVLDEERAQKEALAKQQDQVAILNASRAKVASKYNLEDENSEEYKLYTEAMNENPQFLSNPYGPELTMYEMEKKMRSKGLKLPEERQDFNNEVDLETQRRERIGAGGATPPGSAGGSGKVTLTTQQVQFARENNIPLEAMAKMAKLQASDYQEGVSVDDE